MCLNSYDYQFRVSRFSYESTYNSGNHKSKIYNIITHTKKKNTKIKELKDQRNSKENHHTTKGKAKRTKNGYFAFHLKLDSYMIHHMLYFK